MSRISFDDMHVVGIRIVGLGTFSVDKWMGITFDDSSEPGPGLECCWHGHASNLNENGYVVLWNSWLKFCDENAFEPDLDFVMFRKFMIKCFKMYELLK